MLQIFVHPLFLAYPCVIIQLWQNYGGEKIKIRGQMFMVCSHRRPSRGVPYFKHNLFTFCSRGGGYVGRPPTPKIYSAVLYTNACKKILANFELFFKRRAAPLTKWGRKHLQRVRVCI